MLKTVLVLLRYNKDVVCVIDKNKSPICTISSSISRRNVLNDNKIPSYDPYIPRRSIIFYNCTDIVCKPLKLYSITQLSAPNLKLRTCHKEVKEEQRDVSICEKFRYHYLKNIDKLLFLSDNIPDKKFYMVDCLVYYGGGRICHWKDQDQKSHTELLDTAHIVRANEPNILSQEEFICEESKDKKVVCDLNPYVPFPDGLRHKDATDYARDILLKTGTYVIPLKFSCSDNWCGYHGEVKATTRRQNSVASIPGGKVYRCYYAKKQQICKVLYGSGHIYFEGIQRFN